jgi:hypothetical protein
MNYFVMMPDDRVKNAFKITADSISFDSPEPFAAFCDFQPSTDFVDFFTLRKQFSHLFCASDSLKEMIEIYADNFSSIPFFVTDNHQKGQMVYWVLNLESIDCLEKKPNMRYDSLTLHTNQLKNKYIFRIAFEKQEYVIVSLALAENILRKIPSGIRFYPVNLT